MGPLRPGLGFRVSDVSVTSVERGPYRGFYGLWVEEGNVGT